MRTRTLLLLLGSALAFLQIGYLAWIDSRLRHQGPPPAELMESTLMAKTTNARERVNPPMETAITNFGGGEALPPAPQFPSAEAFFKLTPKERHLTPLRPTDRNQFTIRILTWKRADLLEATTQWSSKCECVKLVQVVFSRLQLEELTSDLRQETLRVLDSISNDPKVYVEQRTTNQLTNRFDVLPETPTPTLGILGLDDDVLYTCGFLDEAFGRWTLHPDRMMTFYPRRHLVVKDGDTQKWNYGMVDIEEGRHYSLGLTGGAFLHRDYLNWFTHYMPHNIRAEIDSQLNCEDIAMTLFIGNLTRKVPQTVDLWARYTSAQLFSNFPFKGISESQPQNHGSARSACLDRYAQQFQIKDSLPLGTVPYLSEATNFTSDDNPRFYKLQAQRKAWHKMVPRMLVHSVLLPIQQDLMDYAKSQGLKFFVPTIKIPMRKAYKKHWEQLQLQPQQVIQEQEAQV